MRQTFKLGVRPSPLALAQAKEIKKIFPKAEFKIVTIATAGDKDKKTPLYKVDRQDFFTGEIDNALLAGEIDLAVHSSKDLPDSLSAGLAVIFETQSLSPFEALVARGNLKLKDLASGARVGVSSQRRKRSLLSLRSDLTQVDIRGNIQERLSLIDKGKIDALIVAYAALIRLGFSDRAAEIFPLDIFPAHPKQGKLALVARNSDKDIIKFKQ